MTDDDPVAPTAPTPQAFAPLRRPVRWGVVSTGHMAEVFTHDLQLLTDECEVVAVASRQLEKAEAWAAEHHVPKAYASYEALAADADVDIVYVSSPHSAHVDNALLLLEAGKHALIEKPMAMSASDAVRIQTAAAAHQRFCCEATWTRFNPLVRQLTDLVNRGVLGDLKHLSCTFGFAFGDGDNHRLLDPALGGGAIWDLGLYPASMMQTVAGRPDRVLAAGSRGTTGVDTNGAALFVWNRPHGTVLGQAYCSLDASTAAQFVVAGSLGRVEFDHFIKPTEMVLTPVEGDPQRFVTSLVGNGYTFQAQEVHRCLRAGAAETALVSWQDTVDVAWMSDRWLAGIGDER